MQMSIVIGIWGWSIAVPYSSNLGSKQNPTESII
jgi:hypothetical protein